MILGILGGIGSGKSRASALFEESGHGRVDADRIGHELLENESVRTELRESFGDEIFDSEGRVARALLARVVFDDPEALARLNDILHPRIRSRILELIDRHRSSAGSSTERHIILDVALLGSPTLSIDCDALIFVDCPIELRRERCAARGWEPGELERREAHQEPLASRRARARWVIDNSGSIENTRSQVEALLDELADDRTEPRSAAPRLTKTNPTPSRKV